MDLKIKDVASLLNVSETTIRRWVSHGKMPAYRLNHQYRFSRSEIENWVMDQKLSKDKEQVVFQDLTQAENIKTGSQQYSLYRAVYKGGVYHNVPGANKEQVIRNTMQLVTKRFELDADVISELLLDRERLMPTALNNGLAVPHTRDFLLKEHFDAIVVVFPEKEIEYGALDGKAVHTMFFLFACEDKRHLHLLAKLAHLSSKEQIQELFKRKPDEKKLLEVIKNWESQNPLT